MQLYQYPAFVDSREARPIKASDEDNVVDCEYPLFQALCTAIEEQDEECYAATVRQFNAVSRLDPWYCQ